ncbi:hypothetical protein BDZ91DRAFT_808084 [Kalaharituber pfeilii]|nr:hypothetical protein BDZ91DRAFT_808084 [Kalaharituber pfeilii]
MPEFLSHISLKCRGACPLGSPGYSAIYCPVWTLSTPGYFRTYSLYAVGAACLCAVGPACVYSQYRYSQYRYGRCRCGQCRCGQCRVPVCGRSRVRVCGRCRCGRSRVCVWSVPHVCVRSVPMRSVPRACMVGAACRSASAFW